MDLKPDAVQFWRAGKDCRTFLELIKGRDQKDHQEWSLDSRRGGTYLNPGARLTCYTTKNKTNKITECPKIETYSLRPELAAVGLYTVTWTTAVHRLQDTPTDFWNPGTYMHFEMF